MDDEGEVLDLVVQRRRDTEAALELLGRLLRNQPIGPEKITTDGLASCGASRAWFDPGSPTGPTAEEQSSEELVPADPTTIAAAAGFQIQASAQRFLTTHAEIYNTFKAPLHMISRLTLRRFRAEADARWAAGKDL